MLRAERYGGFWLLSGYDDVRNAARDWRAFTSSVPNVTAIPSSHPREDPDVPTEFDPPLHTRYRQLVAPAFSRSRVDAMTPRIRAIASQLLEEVIAARGGDLVSGFATPLSVSTLALFLDLPDEDRSLWIGWVRRLFDANDPAGRDEATVEFYAYVDSLVASRDPDPDGDFISTLLASELDGERLSASDVARFFRSVLMAGHETTAAAMSFALRWLAEHPEERRRLSREPALIPVAIEEFLRLSSTVVLSGRNAVRDIELHGTRIPAGDVVALGWAAANVDAAAFAEPTRCILTAPEPAPRIRLRAARLPGGTRRAARADGHARGIQQARHRARHRRRNPVQQYGHRPEPCLIAGDRTGELADRRARIRARPAMRESASLALVIFP